MKHAVCIAGHTRGFDADMSLASSSLQSLGVDFYISTWVNNCDQTMFWAGDKDKDHYNIKLDNLMALYRPIVIDVEKRSDYDIFNHLDFVLPSSFNVNTLNTLLMFKKMKKSIDHAVNSNKEYDLIFRSRFDINSLTLPDELLRLMVYLVMYFFTAIKMLCHVVSLMKISTLKNDSLE